MRAASLIGSARPGDVAVFPGLGELVGTEAVVVPAPEEQPTTTTAASATIFALNPFSTGIERIL
jgi:hypothetical protein